MSIATIFSFYRQSKHILESLELKEKTNKQMRC